MRFGGMLFGPWDSPEQWARAAVDAGYGGVYFPVDSTAKTCVIDGYAQAAEAYGLVISEIGVWNNPMHPDRSKRQAAFEWAVRQLELADYVGANCCVNISGSLNPEVWDGPHPENFSRRAFDEAVEITRRIIDAVKPVRTFYVLEPMPFMYPDSADSYLEMIRAVDRDAFGAHIDIVNILSSPRTYYDNTRVINEWFDKLGSYIKSCHAKDIRLSDELTVHLDECRPGTGNLDYDTYLRRVSRLPDRVCLMLEHLSGREEYDLAADFIRSRACALGIRLNGEESKRA